MTDLKTIAITGGKGGVGKSAIAILLANKLRAEGKRVVLADGDIECPNDYLLLGQKLTKSIDKVKAQFPKLIKEKCRKCGLCVDKCRSKAIFQAPGQYPIFLEELCSGCGLCWHLCPYQAIEVKKKTIGEVFQNKIADNFYLVTGRSVGVVEESGPIVSQTREIAQELAKKIEADYLLVDTAVGLHCGVIRALMGVDLAYAVTEPTPLGVHDLKLILKLLSLLKVKSKIILNQADLGVKKPITRIAQSKKIPIEHELPYSKELARAYSQGKLAKVNIF
ncbi:MAG: P-loop NTPase [Patescibacteria group bacterium]|jgi:MinD superfamily P-loop ATPase